MGKNELWRVYAGKCGRVFGEDGKGKGKGKLWGQAVCTPCFAVLLTGAHPEWSRQSGDRTGGTGTGRKWWGHLLEMVWIYQPCVMVCLFCIVVRGTVRLSGKRRHAEVFPLFGRCEMVSGERAV